MSVGGVGAAGGWDAYNPTSTTSPIHDQLETHSGRVVAEAFAQGADWSEGTTGEQAASLIHLMGLARLELGGGRGETMNAAVIQSLKDFQAAKGLDATGIPDDATTLALEEAVDAIHDSPTAKRGERWSSFDPDTVQDYKDFSVKHGASALDNLKSGAEHIAEAPVFVAKGIYGIFGPNDILGGTNNGIGERLTNPLVGTFLGAMSLLTGLKDVLIDAPVHAVAGLFSKD